MRIVVTGASGQLGSALVPGLLARGLVARGHDVIALYRGAVDLVDRDAVVRLVARFAPDALINAVACNDVDGAEGDPGPALLANALVVDHLAAAAAEAGAAFVHFGTDFVFDGTKEEPYTEEDAPRPSSVYGWSKLLGERLASARGRAYVLRVASLFGGPLVRASVDRLHAALSRGEDVRVFLDRTVSPTHVVDVVRAVATLLESGAPPGLYHAVSSGFTTWQGLGEELCRLLGVPSSRLVPIRLAEAGLRASRPLRCALDNGRLVSRGVAMPTWQEALASAFGR